MKFFLIGLACLAIAASLVSAGFFMMRSDDEARASDDRVRARRMFWSLALRVGLSILLFVGILLAWRLGYMQPTGIPART